MSAESSVKTNSLPWQIRHAGKNLSEWIQRQLYVEDSADSSPPTFELPEWVGQLLLWILVVGATLWLAWLIVQAIDRYLQNHGGRPRLKLTVEEIPDEVEHSVKEWLRLARQFEQAGKWREACRALYMAALQVLHDREWVPHQASRTDGEYLQAIHCLKQPRPLQLLINTHERSLFGGDALTADNLKRCRTAYEEIENR